MVYIRKQKTENAAIEINKWHIVRPPPRLCLRVKKQGSRSQTRGNGNVGNKNTVHVKDNVTVSFGFSPSFPPHTHRSFQRATHAGLFSKQLLASVSGPGSFRLLCR